MCILNSINMSHINIVNVYLCNILYVIEYKYVLFILLYIDMCQKNSLAQMGVRKYSFRISPFQFMSHG